MSYIIDRADVLHMLAIELGKTSNKAAEDVLKAVAKLVVEIPGITDETPHWATEMAYRNGYRDGVETYRPHEDGYPIEPCRVIVYRKRGDYIFCEYDGEKYKYYDETFGWTEVARDEIICWSLMA